MRFGVLGSGKGSNLEALLEAKKKRIFTGDIVLVLSDVKDSRILQIAEEHHVPAEYIYPGSFRTKLETNQEQEYVLKLKSASVDYVVLAGFMRVIKEPLLKAFSNRIINIHPSLLPAFKGIKAWEQALKYGVKVTGCTVHYVNEDLDSGKIIAQKIVEVLENDTAGSLHDRIQLEEHKLLPNVLQQLLESQKQG